MGMIRPFFFVYLILTLNYCFSKNVEFGFEKRVIESKNKYSNKLKNGTTYNKLKKSVQFDCEMLFESIYSDRKSKDILKLFFYLGILDKEIPLEEEILENIEEIKLERTNLDDIVLHEQMHILFEGEYVKENKLDLSQCKVKKETKIPLFNIGETLLHSAVISGKSNIVKLLVLSGLDVNIKLNKSGNSDLPIFGSVGGYVGDLEGMTPLHYVSLIQDLESIEIAKILLKYGADPNSKDRYKRTPLHTVGLSRNLHPKKIAKILLDAGASIKKKDVSKLTPLHFAVSRNNLPVVNLLVSHESNRNMNEGLLEFLVDYNGNTPLHIAAMFNSGDVLPLLINNKNDPMAENFHGLSSIEISAFPIGYRALNSEDISPLAFSVLLTNINTNSFETSFFEKIKEAYYRSIKGGYLQILEKILFLNGSNIKNLSGISIDLDISGGIALAERENSKITSYLRSFGTNILCPNPPVVLNSNYKLSDTVIGNHIRVGDTVTYECFEEYELVGHSTLTCNLGDNVAFYVPDSPSCSIRKNKNSIIVHKENKNIHILLFFGILIISLAIVLMLILYFRGKNKLHINLSS